MSKFKKNNLSASTMIDYQKHLLSDWVIDF